MIGSYTVYRLRWLSLHPPHKCRPQLTNQVRIFRKTLFNTPIPGIPYQVK